MASQAEVDLVISTAGTLPELERDLSRIIRTAESGAPEVDVQASIAVQGTIARLSTELNRVIDSVDASDPTVDVQAAIDTRDSLNALRTDVDRIVRAAQAGADPIALQAALDPVRSLRRIGTTLDSVIRRAEAAAPDIDVNVDTDRASLRQVTSGLATLARGAGSAALSVGRLGATAGSAGVAVGALVPVLAGVAAAAQQIAPAAAVATSGMLALGLAGGSTALAMVGVEDAIKNAFDPDVKPEDLAKSLEGLAPEARKFVVELRGMRAELGRVQQGVQNRFFQDFDETLRTLSVTTLPKVRGALNDTAGVLNEMARGAASAAGELATDGTLGTALNGATKGLENLKGLPAQIVTALGQLAAASSPAFDKLTRRIDTAATEIAEDLARAFESGALEDEIDAAIAALGQLVTIGGNLLEGLGNVFGGLTEDGGGLFDILEKLSEQFVKLTASREFQTILQELSDTAGVLVDAVLPLLQEAFVQLAPVVEELAPLVRDFIQEVGPELIPVLQELGPVLLDIVEIMKEQMPLAIQVTQSLLQILTQVLSGLHVVMQDFVIPAVRGVADIFENRYVKALAEANRLTGSTLIKLFSDFDEFKRRVGASLTISIGNLVAFGLEMRDRFVSSVSGALLSVGDRFRDLPGQIRSALSSAAVEMFGVGANIIRGLINGLVSQIGNLISTARSIADRITSTITGALDIASPSRVMIGVGEDTAAGLVVGLRRMIPEIESTVNGIADTIAPSFALPGGQSLTLSPLSVGAPSVQVFIGNEQLDARTDARIAINNRARDRVLSQGVRR